MKPVIVRADSLRVGAKFLASGMARSFPACAGDVWTVTEVSSNGVVWVTRERDGHTSCFAGCADVEQVRS